MNRASTAFVQTLRRGDLVQALRVCDEGVADAWPGCFGVVFEEANAYGDDGGPMVRWFTGGACNVYDGDVAKVTRLKRPEGGKDISLDEKTAADLLIKYLNCYGNAPVRRDEESEIRSIVRSVVEAAAQQVRKELTPTLTEMRTELARLTKAHPPELADRGRSRHRPD